MPLIAQVIMCPWKFWSGTKKNLQVSQLFWEHWGFLSSVFEKASHEGTVSYSTPQSSSKTKILIKQHTDQKIIKSVKTNSLLISRSITCGFLSIAPFQAHQFKIAINYRGKNRDRCYNRLKNPHGYTIWPEHTFYALHAAEQTLLKKSSLWFMVLSFSIHYRIHSFNKTNTTTTTYRPFL